MVGSCYETGLAYWLDSGISFRRRVVSNRGAGTGRVNGGAASVYLPGDWAVGVLRTVDGPYLGVFDICVGFLSFMVLAV